MLHTPGPHWGLTRGIGDIEKKVHLCLGFRGEEQSREHVKTFGVLGNRDLGSEENILGRWEERSFFFHDAGS